MPYIGNEPADRFTSIPTVQQFNGDGSTTAFTLSRTVSSDQDILVSVDGVIQDTAAYAVSSGTTLTFSAAPSTGTANIFVNHLGLTIGSVVHPASSSVSAAGASLDGAVTINDSSADVDFRVESNGNANMLFVNGGTDKIGIGVTDPDATLDVSGGENKLGIFRVTQRADGAAAYGLDVGLDSSTGDPVFSAIVNDSLTEAIRINRANAAVTMPAQPAFQAFPTSAQTDIAINTAVTIVLGTEGFDLGANFASNTFTAPVTGKYQLNVVLSAGQLDIDATFYQLQLVTSNKSYDQTLDPLFSSDPVYWSWSFSVLADMDASDTAVIKLYQAAGAAQADIGTGTTFSGYLVA